jgi:hypothetical protein|tara:strand:+ start:83 stop:277 length:195 start_codon:yes stop_codon:yes gene_type:complete
MGIALSMMFGLFMWDNQTFFGTAEKQVAEGYKWEYVGKTEPSGVPAITVMDHLENESIYFKLSK